VTRTSKSLETPGFVERNRPIPELKSRDRIIINGTSVAVAKNQTACFSNMKVLGEFAQDIVTKWYPCSVSRGATLLRGCVAKTVRCLGHPVWEKSVGSSKRMLPFFNSNP
jgi:hypothetical protein